MVGNLPGMETRQRHTNRFILPFFRLCPRSFHIFCSFPLSSSSILRFQFCSFAVSADVIRCRCSKSEEQKEGKKRSEGYCESIAKDGEAISERAKRLRTSRGEQLKYEVIILAKTLIASARQSARSPRREMLGRNSNESKTGVERKT